MNVVPKSSVDGIAETIKIAPMSEVIPCINDTSGASGQAYKTHRSMNAIKMLDGSPFVGENVNQIGKDYYAVTNVEAEQTFDKCAKDSANGLLHIAYIARATDTRAARFTSMRIPTPSSRSSPKRSIRTGGSGESAPILRAAAGSSRAEPPKKSSKLANSGIVLGENAGDFSWSEPAAG
ncbi:MAG: hypothetical protein HONBIEJF_01967 [Fimbriimonadaceae bacterium]|nr:hypothetical protein [Fimbriimonadaceae bacterium]